MPLGPPSLCAEKLMSAMPEDSTSIGILPALCAASECSGMPRALHSPAIAATSVSTPVSLFACISDTRAVSGRKASSTCDFFDGPVRPRPQPGHVEALALELAAGVKARPMLDARGHDVAPRGSRRARCTQDPEVHALGRTRSQDDRLGRGIDEARPLRPARMRCARPTAFPPHARTPGSPARSDRRGTRPSRRRRVHRAARSRRGRDRSARRRPSLIPPGAAGARAPPASRAGCGLRRRRAARARPACARAHRAARRCRRA